jgi:serine/threonine protein kinase
MDIKCVLDDKRKEYIIPTKSWLTAIKQMKIEEVSTAGTNILSELVGKEKVLVKLTNKTNIKLKTINNAIRGLPNMVYTYCVIFCHDYLPLILQNKQFCNLDNNKHPVTLEVMKMYNGGTIDKIKELDIKFFKKILSQLIFAQINLFMKSGFTHCDIHPGNILINKHPHKVELNYSYLLKPKKIQTKYEFILCDYDKSIDFNPDEIIEYINQIYGDNDIEEIVNDLINQNLFSNIITTINMLINKLNMEYKKSIRKIFVDAQIKNNNIIENQNKILKSYISYLYNDKNEKKINIFKKYKEITHNDCITFYENFIKML